MGLAEEGATGGATLCHLAQAVGAQVFLEVGKSATSLSLDASAVPTLRLHVAVLVSGEDEETRGSKEADDALGGERADILFIDSGRRFDTVCRDYATHRHLVRHGGYVVFAACDRRRWPGVALAAEHVAAAPGNRLVGFMGGDHCVICMGCAPPSSRRKRGERRCRGGGGGPYSNDATGDLLALPRLP